MHSDIVAGGFVMGNIKAFYRSNNILEYALAALFSGATAVFIITAILLFAAIRISFDNVIVALSAVILASFGIARHRRTIMPKKLWYTFIACLVLMLLSMKFAMVV